MTYGVILADPPWKFRTYDGKKSVASRTAADPYPTMTVEELCAMASFIDGLAAKDCALFMWAVDAHLEHALQIGRAWGFTYKTIAFVWDKDRIGMGYWTRKQAEVCLMFTRGHPHRLHKDVRQIIRAPRREHSRKPGETHHLVERLVAGPYIELFARSAVSGWAAWGNETAKFSTGP